MLSEQAIKGVKGNMGGVDLTNLLACLLPVLLYGGWGRSLVSSAKDLVPAESWEIIHSGTFIVPLEETLTIDQGRPTRRDMVKMTP